MKIISTSDSLFSSFLPKRNENTSKFDYGRAVLLGGSKDYGGAPLLSLASLSSLRLGAGFATLYVPEPLYSIYVGRDPQIIVHSFPSKDGNLLFDSGYLEEITKKATAIAIGMGVTGFEECQKILEYFLKNYHGYLIVDAGALRAFANIPNEHLKHISCHLILTPHITSLQPVLRHLPCQLLPVLRQGCAERDSHVLAGQRRTAAAQKAAGAEKGQGHSL